MSGCLPNMPNLPEQPGKIEFQKNPKRTWDVTVHPGFNLDSSNSK